MKTLLSGSVPTHCAVALLLVAACDPASRPVDETQELPSEGMTASAVIGLAGGSIELGEVALRIPRAALAGDTEIRVTVVEDATPDAFSAYSPVFHFEPSGLVFDEPVSVSLPYNPPSTHANETATIFWTVHGSDTYMALPTTVEAGVATAQISHFSEAFVGSGCAGDDCCDAANGKLDLVLLVDNSNSMSEEQAALSEQLPRMARILATGDLDQDGEQDFPALESVRVGVLTPDMGTSGYTIATCENPDWGDDGLLRTAGNASLAECEASYPSFAELSADHGPEGIEGFVEHVQCVGMAGTGGCGFEQPLEALLKAVTPGSSEMRFHGGTTGHGDGMNAGFLRDDSMVAFLVLTDEEDCSTDDAEMFNPTRDDLPPLNIRCAMREEALHPVSRYIEGFQSLREDPADVLFGLLGGVPADLVTDPEGLDYAGLLADERMEARVDSHNPNELLPSCESSSGRAYPPRRMVQVAEGFGGNGVVQSICQNDFTPAMAAMLERMAARARGECM